MCKTDILCFFFDIITLCQENALNFPIKRSYYFFQILKELYVCTTIACFELYLIEEINTPWFSYSSLFSNIYVSTQLH